jgi:hypothetical protein
MQHCSGSSIAAAALQQQQQHCSSSISTAATIRSNINAALQHCAWQEH